MTQRPLNVASSEQRLCVSCGYDLRGQSEEANCPECGTPVERSLRGDALEVADPKWLATVMRGVRLGDLGCRLVVISIIGFYIMFFGYALAVGFFTIPDRIEDAIGDALRASLQVAVVVGLLLCGVGAVLFTQRDPREGDRDDSTSDQNLTRYGLGVSCVLAAAALGALSFGSATANTITSGVFLALTSIALCIAAVASFRSLHALSRRAGAADVAGQWLKLRHSLWICMPGLGVAMAVRIMKPMFGGAPRWLDFIVNLALLICGIWLLVIAGRSAGALKRLHKRMIVCRKAQDHSAISKSANSNPGATTHPSSA